MIKFTNTADFNKKLVKFAKLAEIDVRLVAKRMAFAVYQSVIEKTPVDTGRARASWNITQGHVDPSVESASDYKESAGQGSGRAEAVNRNKLSKVTSGGFVEFPVYYITNNLPYIIPLEEGHSKQAGKGYMVKRTIVQIQADLDNLIKRVSV